MAENEKTAQGVLITGATGFIGSRAAAACAAESMRVRCLVRSTSRLGRLRGLPIETFIGDVTDPSGLNEAVEGMDLIIHAAGATRGTSDEDYYRVNAAGTLNLLKAVMRVRPGLRRFVYVSSQAAGGPSSASSPRKESDPPKPVGAYGRSKLAGEAAVTAFAQRLPVTIVRPPVVLGPGAHELESLIRLIRLHVRPVWGRRSHYVSFIDIEDLVRGILTAVRHEAAAGETFYLVADGRLLWDRFFKILAGRLNKWTVPVRVPVRLIRCLAVLMEWHGRKSAVPPLLNVSKVREMNERFWICDGGKAERLLNFYPRVSLEESIDRTVRWFDQEGFRGSTKDSMRMDRTVLRDCISSRSVESRGEDANCSSSRKRRDCK
ncbi:MAG TPA: NAD-dependent epimerase/dehydratase family protein [bacterium]|nr:NAD-dependent epimerase/dehydratase family protein [bacterium]